MKRAFTMIELIFVIVILGILSAIAIPRLAATRDDAENAKQATNMSVLVTDIASYYTTNGNLSSNMSEMSNVNIGNAAPYAISILNIPCVDVDIRNDVSANIAYVRFSRNAANSANPKCSAFYRIPTVSQMLNTTASYESGGSLISLTGAYVIGGKTRINF